MSRIIVGVMGGADVSPEAERDAYRLGALIANAGWVLLNGGRDSGVMAASAAGAHAVGGLTIGILPDDNTSQAAVDLDVRIVTGMGSARNAINVLSSDVVIACEGGAGTISEVALALKHGKPVITLNLALGELFAEARTAGQLQRSESPQQAVDLARKALDRRAKPSS